MVLRLQVDAKALTIAYLKGHSSVSALAGTRVSDRAKGSVWPQVTVTSFGGREVVAPGGRVSHLDELYLQVDAWGEHAVNDQATTQLLARTVRAALLDMASASHALGVVTRVRTITPPMDYADELDRARVRAEYGVFVHPHPL